MCTSTLWQTQEKKLKRLPKGNEKHSMENISKTRKPKARKKTLMHRMYSDYDEMKINRENPNENPDWSLMIP